MTRQPLTAKERILALGEKASLYTEADLARKVGVSRERIRQLKSRLPHKPINTMQDRVTGYGVKVERAFYTAMRLGIDRLVAMVDARGDDECWPWLGRRNKRYGLLGPGSRYVHRLIYEREYGPIPKGMLVVHKFAGPQCCNPRHLVLATERERTWRIFRAGRFANVSDDLRKLTPARLRAIRRAYAKLPKVKVVLRGKTIERVSFRYAEAMAERFGIKNRNLLSQLATGRVGCWILPGRP